MASYLLSHSLSVSHPHVLLSKPPGSTCLFQDGKQSAIIQFQGTTAYWTTDHITASPIVWTEHGTCGTASDSIGFAGVMPQGSIDGFAYQTGTSDGNIDLYKAPGTGGSLPQATLQTQNYPSVAFVPTSTDTVSPVAVASHPLSVSGGTTSGSIVSSVFYRKPEIPGPDARAGCLTVHVLPQFDRLSVGQRAVVFGHLL